MGATWAESDAQGIDVREAFRNAVDAARYEVGFGGYSGTICEKPGFKIFHRPEGMTADEITDAVNQGLDGNADPRVAQMVKVAKDKWGVAVAIELREGESWLRVKEGNKGFRFFGLASC